jgi:monofunctional biosynthetic peptidoglycan transglycosylase
MVRQDDTLEPTAAPPGSTPASQPFGPQTPSDDGLAADGCELPVAGVSDLSSSPPRPLPPRAFADPFGSVTDVDQSASESPDLHGRTLASNTSSAEGPADGVMGAPLATPVGAQFPRFHEAVEPPLAVEAVLAEIDAEASARSLTAVETAIAEALGHGSYETGDPEQQQEGSVAADVAPSLSVALAPRSPVEPRLARPSPPAFPPLVADPSFRHGLPQSLPADRIPTPRDYKALAKRGGKLAAMIAGGWLAAVLVLIVAYRFINPPVSALMLQQWLSGQDIAHEWVAIEDMSPNIVRAVLLSEDGRFCEHYGVDYEALREAMERAGSGSIRGASTISMQVIKNLFLWPSKSFLRKAIELPLTYVMELIWPKRRIMEVYLNIAEWGPGIFGVGKAAAFYFNKSARSLSEREAARLAAALPNPLVRNASRPGPGMQRLAGAVQVRMRLAPTSQLACVLPKRRL